MKKIIVLFAAAVLMLAGCGSSSASTSTQTAAETVNETEKETQTEASSPEGADADALVIYFSRTGEQYVVGVIDKGNTAIVAEMIAEETGADLFEVLPEDDHYPMTYDALTDVAKREQNDNARPAYSGELPDLSGYSTIYIGAPVWWGEEPRILDTFVEKYSFDGITVIPFCTSGGSGIGRSESNMESLAGSGTWLDGERFSSGVSEEELQSWIDGLK